jgi:Clostripain family
MAKAKAKKVKTTKVKTTKVKTTTEKQWTVMVYLAGDNNLDGAGVVDLQEMKQVGSSDQLSIIAQFDREGAGGETNRYYVRKGGSLDKDRVQGLGETNTGDPEVLENFITWGMQTYPAKHYLVVLWNHGAGWDDTNIYRLARDIRRTPTRKKKALAKPARAAVGTVTSAQIRAVSKRAKRSLFSTTVEQGLGVRAIAFDDNAKDFLDNLELKKVLQNVKKKLGRNIDILGMDACLMNMAEVAYQVRDSVDLTVGSEETEPNDGWPYDTILADLAKKPTMPPRDLAALVVKKYVASYPASEPVTQSALDLSKAAEFLTAVNKLAKLLKSAIKNSAERFAVMQAREQVQAYHEPSYIDLRDFCELLKHHTTNANLKIACDDVLAVATKPFVLASGFKNSAMANSHGVSIYFPRDEVSPLYQKLDFSKKTSWNEFLQAYIEATTRRP